jgi:hypothetical protein
MSLMKNFLDSIDMPDNFLSEADIWAKLSEIDQKALLPEELEIFNFEFTAFGFMEDYDWKNWSSQQKWDTYYGPILVWKNPDNATWTIASHRDKITEPMINYWIQRMDTVKNPLLKIHYAGIIWDFYCHTLKTKKPYLGGKAAHVFIDTVVENFKPREIHSKFKRALQIAISQKDEKRIIDLKNVLLSNSGEDWVFLYDELLDRKKGKNLSLNQSEENEIILGLEGQLSRFKENLPNHFVGLFYIEPIVEKLAAYYKKHQNKKGQEKVMQQYLDCVEQQSKKGEAIQVQFLLNKAHSIIKNFSSKKNENKILLDLQEIGPKVIEESKILKVESSIDNDKIQGLLEELSAGSFEEALNRTIFYFTALFSESKVKEDIKNGINYLGNIPASMHLIDKKGRIIKKLKSEDVVPYNLAGKILFLSQFLTLAFKKIFEKNTTSSENLVEYLYQSPAFRVEQKPFIEMGIRAYFKRRFIEALHVLIPQIEWILRFLSSTSKESTLKNRDGSGFDWISLGALLSNENMLDNIFGKEIIFYFKVLLTDPVGLNLRNDIMHALADPNIFNENTASLILHILFILRYSPWIGEAEGE